MLFVLNTVLVESISTRSYRIKRFADLSCIIVEDFNFFGKALLKQNCYFGLTTSGIRRFKL